MPYVVTDNCQRCRFTDCVEVCPVDCFYADKEMLYIHPDECIDCGACEPACPVEATGVARPFAVTVIVGRTMSPNTMLSSTLTGTGSPRSSTLRRGCGTKSAPSGVTHTSVSGVTSAGGQGSCSASCA